MNVHVEIASLLIDIEAQLRSLDQWQQEPPSAEALASTEPFCVDTLTFVQWLQFIFLPRMRALVSVGKLPPGPCAIAPLAEEYFSGSNLPVQELLRVIGDLDRLVSSR